LQAGPAFAGRQPGSGPGVLSMPQIESGGKPIPVIPDPWSPPAPPGTAGKPGARTGREPAESAPDPRSASATPVIVDGVEGERP